jgi:uncharacterized damage-inducible protein DinB
MDLEYLLGHWEQVRAGLSDTIDTFHDDELDVRPYTAGRSVRQIVLHIAQEEHGEFGYGIVQTLDAFPAEYSIQEYPTKAALRVLLASVHAPTVAYLRALEPADLSRGVVTPWGASYRLIEMIGHMIEHEIHHRGELSLILGMLGRSGFDA